MTIRKAQIEDFGLHLNTDNAARQEEHDRAVASLKETGGVDGEGFRVGALADFKESDGDPESILNYLTFTLRWAIAANRVLDFGVVPDQLVRDYADKTSLDPVEWTQPHTLFLASHPGIIGTANSVSLYLLNPRAGGDVMVTEMLYVEPTRSILVVTSLSVPNPLGASRTAKFLAWTDEPNAGLVSSALNPVLMGVALLANPAPRAVS